MAYETDLLEYGDLFDGSAEVTRKVEELKAGARDELARIDEMGGSIPAVETGYMKQKLVESNATRLAAIEAGEQVVVGVNKFAEGEDSPLTAGDGSILTVDPASEAAQIERLKAWREQRDNTKVDAALDELKAAAREGRNIMEPSIAAAHAGVTTGEWGTALRDVFGEYRAPTGVGGASSAAHGDQLVDVRTRVDAVSAKMGRRVKMLVGKPGLDGHSNGAEQIAVRARDAGMEVVYEGIRLTPAQIVNAALEEGVHVIGLSILSGSHVPLVSEVLERMKEAEIMDIPLVVGGIIPPEDEAALLKAGVARIYTPKDYEINMIMADIVGLIEQNEAA
jgi:(2R)-ethylmalonyl-CoA mutase